MKYKYQALVVAIYDGDTITVDLDLGFGIVYQDQRIRLFGINAPEMRGIDKEIGKASRDFLRNEILGENIILESIKDKKGKYGRYLGIIHYNGENINKKMIDTGHAVPVEY